MTSVRVPSRENFLPTARGMVLGATFGLLAVALLADFVARVNGSSAAWALGLVVLYHGAIPAMVAGALTGRWIARRRARQDAEASRRGAPRAPTHPLGGLSGLILAVCATLVLLSVYVRASELLRLYLGAMPAVGATALLLLRLGTLVAIWQIGRGTSRAVSEAVDTRGGRPPMVDLAVVAVFLGFCALLLGGMALDDVLWGRSVAQQRDAAIGLAVALLIGATARALLRRSRYATPLAATVAALIVGTTFTWSVLAPPADGAGPMQGYQDTVVVTAVMVGFVAYVHWRLSRTGRATTQPTSR